MVSVHLSHLWTFTWRKVSFGCLQSNTTRPTIAIVTSPRLLDTIWYTTTSRQQERADLVNDVSFYFLKFWTDSPLRCVICFSLLQIGKNHAFNVQFSSYFFFQIQKLFWSATKTQSYNFITNCKCELFFDFIMVQYQYLL